MVFPLKNSSALETAGATASNSSDPATMIIAKKNVFLILTSCRHDEALLFSFSVDERKPMNDSLDKSIRVVSGENRNKSVRIAQARGYDLRP
jgi:hypothetical protein